jgi:hypothetical protein
LSKFATILNSLATIPNCLVANVSSVTFVVFLAHHFLKEVLNLLEKLVAHLSSFLFIHLVFGPKCFRQKTPFSFHHFVKFFFINKEQDLIHNQVTLILILPKPTFS